MATPDWFPEDKDKSDWVEWSAPAFPEGLTTAVQTVGTVTGAITTALNIVKTALQALSALQLKRLDLTQVAVTAAVTAIDAALKALETDTGVYILLVPPRRKVVIPTVLQAALDAAGLPGIPPGKVNLRVIELQNIIAKQGVDQRVLNFLRESSSANGGSAGFLRTFVESLTDENDADRPQLANTDAVAGLVLISGAPDYASLLGFLMTLDSLVGQGPATSALTAPDVPTPQDLQVLKRVNGAQLTWKPQPAIVNVPALDSSFTLTEVAVIRSEDPAILTARTPLDVFGTHWLTEGLKKGKAEVIKLRQNITAMTTYLDSTVGPDSPPYYYALSFHIINKYGEDTGFGPLSNVVKHVYGKTKASTRSGNSVPPDWIRSPRVIDMIPAVAKVFDTIRSAGKTLQGTTLGADVSIKAYVKFLEQLIAQYSRYVDTANDAIQQISAVTSGNLQVGVGIYDFAGVGGLPFLTKSVASATSQLRFSGSHFVGGAVILCAGPSHAVIAPVWSAVELLLGTKGADDSIFKKALEGLNDQLTVLKDAVLGDDMQPTDVASRRDAVAEPNPADACEPFEPTIPVIKDDFTT